MAAPDAAMFAVKAHIRREANMSRNYKHLTP